MRRDYDTMILGCSCFGMGCAAQSPENTLILESGEGFGGEFVDALRACGPIERPVGEASALYDELIARGIMDEASAARGELHLPAVNVVLNRIALEKKLNILFRTRVIAVEKTEKGALVQAVCNAKIYEFTCRRVLDTRSTDFKRIRALDEDAAFGMAANLYVPALPEGDLNGMSVRRGFLPGEAYLTMSVDMPSSGDREKLLSAFANRPVEWKDCRLLQTAPARPVICRPIREETETGFFIPGCGFNDPVSAWAAGLCEKEALA